MKTLKEELQEIVDEKKLDKSRFDRFICSHLSDGNTEEFEKHKEIASKYAKKYFYGGMSWWQGNDLTEKQYNFVISEKYRFIEDLIKILP